ncbi:MAG: response regulator [Desulfobacteraceae bacterium]|jgi:DNA-binding response OmpR family regulator
MCNVLVIDDEEMVRDLLKQALSRVDVVVETVGDAEKGMAKFDNGAFDLVITDVRMPGVDGHRILHHIRKSKRNRTPVIGVSGTPWLLSKGDFDDVLHKPFAIRHLLDKVHCLTHPVSEN